MKVELTDKYVETKITKIYHFKVDGRRYIHERYSDGSTRTYTKAGSSGTDSDRIAIRDYFEKKRK